MHMLSDQSPEAPPCLECGTTGGGHDSRYGRPRRSRDLCRECYDRLRRLGQLDARHPIRSGSRNLFRAKALGAAPCVACGTIAGSVASGTGKPRRPRGMCVACYERFRCGPGFVPLRQPPKPPTIAEIEAERAKVEAEKKAHMFRPEPKRAAPTTIAMMIRQWRAVRRRPKYQRPETRNHADAL